LTIKSTSNYRITADILTAHTMFRVCGLKTKYVR
jgi:hypothetical protein